MEHASIQLERLAVALPNRLKVITSFLFVPVVSVSRFQTDKALANLAILGRRRQKILISPDRKGDPNVLNGKGGGYKISTNPKLGNLPPTSRHTAAKKKNS
jgi:hypothetical protein